MSLLRAPRCSVASHRVARSAGALGHQVPPSSPPVPGAKSRSPTLMSCWGAAPGTGSTGSTHSWLSTTGENSAVWGGSPQRDPKTARQYPRQSDSCACPGSTARLASVAHFREGTCLLLPREGPGWLDPHWQHWCHPNLCPITSVLGVAKPGSAAAGVKGCVAGCWAWQSRGLGLRCLAWGALGVFWDAPKSGHGERWPASFSVPASLLHAGMLVISEPVLGGKLRHSPPGGHGTVPEPGQPHRHPGNCWHSDIQGPSDALLLLAARRSCCRALLGLFQSL